MSSSAIEVVKSKLKNEDKNIKEIILNEKNAEKLSKTFCKLRGAPLKLAQMLSIQEDELIPKEIRQQFERARNQAFMMPRKQLDQMLVSQLGSDWKQKFQKFDEVPIAAASIGQVHQAIDQNGKKVAVKIQYPGVNESIDSDLDNLLFVMKLSSVFPKQMYLDKLILNTRLELKEECNYKLEALKQIRFRSNFKGYQEFNIPNVNQQLSSDRVITTEFIDGHTIDYIAENYSQEDRNRVGKYLMKLTLTELFKFRFMQTDPNPANYFFNQERQQLNLIDFGAAREFDKEFIDTYIQILHGAAHKDNKKVLEYSKQLGFLTGEENIQMKEAHCESVIAVGTPFQQSGNFDFGTQDMTQQVYKKVPVMLNNRLKPPPQEVYSLHRKLSGTFLINMKVRANYNSRDIFMELYDNYKFN